MRLAVRESTLVGKRTWTILAVVAITAAGVTACFPDYEFPGDDSGVHPGDSGVDATVGEDAGDGGLGPDGSDATITDATSDAIATNPLDATPFDAAPFDAGVDSGLLVDAVLLLHLDESSFVGTGAINDSSGAGNNASLAGAASGVTPTTAGKFQGAASFNGTGWIEIPNSASLALTNKFTLSAWVSYTVLLGNNVSPGIIVKRAGFGAASYTLFLWNTNNADDVWVDEESRRLSSPPPAPGSCSAASPRWSPSASAPLRLESSPSC